MMVQPLRFANAKAVVSHFLNGVSVFLMLATSLSFLFQHEFFVLAAATSASQPPAPPVPDCFGFLSVNVDTQFRQDRKEEHMKDFELHRNIRDLFISLYTLAVHHPGAKAVVLTDRVTYNELKNVSPRPALDLHLFVELNRFNNMTQLYPPMRRNFTTNVDNYGIHKSEIPNWKLRKSFRRWMMHRDVTELRGDLNDRAMTTIVASTSKSSSTTSSTTRSSGAASSTSSTSSQERPEPAPVLTAWPALKQDGSERAMTLWTSDNLPTIHDPDSLFPAAKLQYRMVEKDVRANLQDAAGYYAVNAQNTMKLRDRKRVEIAEQQPQGTFLEFEFLVPTTTKSASDAGAAPRIQKKLYQNHEAGQGMPFAESPLWDIMHGGAGGIVPKDARQVERKDTWGNAKRFGKVREAIFPSGEQDDNGSRGGKTTTFLCTDLLHPDADVIFLAKQELPFASRQYQLGVIKQQANSIHAALVWTSDKHFGQAFARDYQLSALAKDKRNMIRYQMGVWNKDYNGNLWEYLPLNRLTRAYFELGNAFLFERPALFDLNLQAAQFGIDHIVQDMRILYSFEDGSKTNYLYNLPPGTSSSTSQEDSKSSSGDYSKKPELLWGTGFLPIMSDDKIPKRMADIFEPWATGVGKSPNANPQPWVAIDVDNEKGRREKRKKKQLSETAASLPRVKPFFGANGKDPSALFRRRHEAMIKDDWISRQGHRESLKILHTRFAHRCCFRTNILLLNVLRRAHKFNELATVFALSLSPYYEAVWENVRRELVGPVGTERKTVDKPLPLFDEDTIFNRVIATAKRHSFRVPYTTCGKLGQEQKIISKREDVSRTRGSSATSSSTSSATSISSQKSGGTPPPPTSRNDEIYQYMRPATFSNEDSYPSDRLKAGRLGYVDQRLCAVGPSKRDPGEDVDTFAREESETGAEYLASRWNLLTDEEFFNHELTWRYIIDLYARRFKMPGNGHYAKQDFNVTADTGHISFGRRRMNDQHVRCDYSAERLP
ncbi:unnamed protein product [Amoebophrya sp. A120]|nr:unnamed protein product [Amoebophrya sp. A120]|eukprot:GSA120T00012024001.1